jgi:hypothetical protein
VSLEALKQKYKAEIGIAKANLDILIHKAVGIGEHSDIIAEMDKWIGVIADNQEKIVAIDSLYKVDESQGSLWES